MLTLPVIVFVPAAPPGIPPAIFAARVATVSVKVPLARIEPAFTVKVPETSTRPVWVTVPAAEMTRLLKVLLALRMAMLAAPLIVTVLVPFVNTEPAPLVSQLPLLVNEPVVSLIIPLVPPVIATLDTVTVEALAVRIPPLPTRRAPPVKPTLAVASAVVEEPSEIVSVPPQMRALVAIVNVWTDAAEELKETLLNSLPGRLFRANVIVPPVALVNVTVPVPGFHEADVDAFVQVPVTAHVDVPMPTEPFAALTFTLPLNAMADPFAVKLPKVAMASAPAVMPKFDADVVKIVGPVAPPVELRIVRVAPILNGFAAIVYVMLVVTLASSVRLLNSFAPPASAANVSVPLVASRIVTVLVPAAHEAEVDRLVHRPLTVQLDAPRLMIVAAVSTSTSPVIVIVELRAWNVP